MLKNVRWWVPISIQKLYGAEGEDDDPAPESQADDDGGDDDSDDDVSDDTFDRAYVEKIRQEAAAKRVAAKTEKERADALEAELAAIKEAEMNDLEKATSAAEKAAAKAAAAEARAEAAEAAMKQTAISTAVTLAAVEQNFQDPKDALSMISQDDLLDEEGEVSDKAVKSALTKLAKAKPYLLKTRTGGTGDGGPTGKPADQSGFAAKQKAYLEEMTKSGGRIPAA